MKNLTSLSTCSLNFLRISSGMFKNTLSYSQSKSFLAIVSSLINNVKINNNIIIIYIVLRVFSIDFGCSLESRTLYIISNINVVSRLEKVSHNNEIDLFLFFAFFTYFHHMETEYF